MKTKTYIAFCLVIGIVLIAMASTFNINSNTNFVANAQTQCGVACQGSYNYNAVWLEDTNTATHTASVATNAVITWIDKGGHAGCGVGSVTIPATTKKVGFSVWWPNTYGTPPAGTYALTLTGFNP